MGGIPDALAILIAEFERSGVAELRLEGPAFELILRAGNAPRWIERIPDPQSANK